jgi:septal ring factor EnvC (AmiA/AmiB activator)
MGPSPKSPEAPAHVVIDKDMTARVNVGILIAVVVSFVLGTAYLSDIEHAIDTANNTLQEVKAQLATNNGAVIQQARDIIRLQDRQQRIEEDIAVHAKRLDALEKAK